MRLAEKGEMTVNHLEYGDLSGLPRSVRWRIQLGLFVDPSTEDPTATTNLEFCFQWNSETVSQQNARFRELMEKYIEEEEEVKEAEQEATAAHTALDIDPLTAIVREQEERESRKAELYLKYRKEKARRKRGLVIDGGYDGNGENDGIDRASVSCSQVPIIIPGINPVHLIFLVCVFSW
jgi:hypothetical protein